MKVATSTSITSPSPCGRFSRSQTACTIARPIQSAPKKVTAIAHETCSRRGRSVASKNVTGKDAARTMITWRGSP